MDVSSYYSSYLTNKATDSYNTVSSSLNVSADSSDDELMEACKSFEEYFLEKVYDNLIDTTKMFSDEDDESDTYASQMVDYFKDSAIQALTQMSSDQGGIGIAQELYNQMKVQYSAISPSELEETE